MRKTFKLDELDCANCGAKIEAGIKQIEGVNDAKVTFMTQKLCAWQPQRRRTTTQIQKRPKSSRISTTCVSAGSPGSPHAAFTRRRRMWAPSSVS